MFVGKRRTDADILCGKLDESRKAKVLHAAIHSLSFKKTATVSVCYAVCPQKNRLLLLLDL